MVRADAPRVTVATATAPEQWIDWPGAQLPADIQPAITTGNPGQALSSVLAGLGRAVLPMPLVEEAIAAGKLEILEGPSDSRRAYWLVAPLPPWRHKTEMGRASCRARGVQDG